MLVNQQQLYEAGLPESACFTCVDVEASHRQRLEEWVERVPLLPSRVAEKRQREFYSGRWAAACAIHSLGGLRATPGVAHDRSPSWPAGLVGSISHTDEWALAIVADAVGAHRLGIDLEFVPAVSVIQGLEEVVCSASEHHTLANAVQCSLMTSSDILALVFSAKESLFKALYTEVQSYFDYLDAEVADIQASYIELRLLKALNEALPKGTEFRLSYIFTGQHVLTWHLELL